MIEKAIIFGNLPIATKVVKLLRERDVEILGCVIGDDSRKYHDPWDEIGLADYCVREKIPTFNFDGLITLVESVKYNVIGFSCRFNRILPKRLIALFSEGVINFHGGLLPEMGGLYSSCHTILENCSKGGGTIHYIDEFIDNGDIILRCEFDVMPDDNSYIIFQKTQEALLSGFTNVIDDILEKRVQVKSQAELVKEGYAKRYYDKNSIFVKKRLRGDEGLEYIYKVVRAFDFPGHEPAFIEFGEKRIYLTAQEFFKH